MEIVYDVDGLRDYLERVGADTDPAHPTIYLDRFLEDSIEVDVDALCDGEDVWIAGIMQHVEEAGIHSGDSACVLPPHTLGGDMLDRIREQTTGIARALGVVGLLNVQFAIRGDDRLYVIEANPRASRTVPFVSKAIGLPLAKLACRIMLGERIADLGLPGHGAVRARVRQGGGAAVQPLRRRRLAAGARDALHRRGDGDRRRLPDRVRQGPGGGGRQAAQSGHGVPHRRRRRQAGRHRDRQPAARPRLRDHRHPRHRPVAAADGDPGHRHQQDQRGPQQRGGLDRARSRGPGDQHPDRHRARTDGYEIRSAAIARGIPCITTMSGGLAAARAIISARRGEPEVVSLQELHRTGTSAATVTGAGGPVPLSQ